MASVSSPRGFRHVTLLANWCVRQPGSSFELCVQGFYFLFFLPHHSACGILVPRPGIEPTPLAVEAWSLNQWTAREVLCAGVLLGCRYIGWTDWIINHMNKLHLQPPSPPWRSGWYCIAQGSNPLIKWLEVLAEAELVSTPMWSERSTMNNNDSPVTGEIPRV